MGTYLSCGIAKTIKVKKENFSKKEIIEKLSKAIDINIYDLSEDTDECLKFELKKDIVEKYAVKFAEEQLKIAEQDINKTDEDSMSLKSLENKKYDELMEILESNQCYNFQLIEGFRFFENDISYITKGLLVFADIIKFLDDGKAIMECYSDVFRYFRNQGIENSNNPIKTAMVVTITE